jgi:hypothetical protein
LKKKLHGKNFRPQNEVISVMRAFWPKSLFKHSHESSTNGSRDYTGVLRMNRSTSKQISVIWYAISAGSRNLVNHKDFWTTLYFTEAYLQNVDPSESQMDQISFEHTIYAIIILPFCTLKFVKSMFRIEHSQRMIIKSFLNKGAGALDIADTPQALFSEHIYKLRTV